MMQINDYLKRSGVNSESVPFAPYYVIRLMSLWERGIQ